jgi:arylsulfatase A-like enzyme
LSRREPLCWKIGPQWAVRSGNWKLIKPFVNAPAMLFDLDTDNAEQKDLAGKHPEKYAGLEAQWKSWNQRNEKARWEDKRSDLRQGIMYQSKQ